MPLTFAKECPEIWLAVWKGLRVRPRNIGVAMLFIDRIESKRRRCRKEIARATSYFEDALSRLSLAGRDEVNLKQVSELARQIAAARIELAALDFDLRQAHDDLQEIASHHRSELAQLSARKFRLQTSAKKSPETSATTSR